MRIQAHIFDINGEDLSKSNINNVFSPRRTRFHQPAVFPTSSFRSNNNRHLVSLVTETVAYQRKFFRFLIFSIIVLKIYIQNALMCCGIWVSLIPLFSIKITTILVGIVQLVQQTFFGRFKCFYLVSKHPISITYLIARIHLSLRKYCRLFWSGRIEVISDSFETGNPDFFVLARLSYSVVLFS